MTITHSTVSTAPNTGRAGVIGSTAWNAEHKDSATPEAFGASANGVADDTTAVQAAVNANSRVVLTPGRTYVFKNVTLRSGVRIEAYGATINAPSGAASEADAFFKALGTSGSHLSNISIVGGAFDHKSRVGSVIYATYVDGLMVEGATSDTPQGAPYRFAYCTNLSVVRCELSDQTFVGGSNGGAITLDHCTDASVIECRTNNTQRDAILAYYSTSVAVRGCHVTDFNMGNIAGRGGIHFYRAQNCICADNFVTKVTPSGSTTDDAPAIRFRNTPEFTCHGNSVSGGAFGIVVVQVNDEDTATGYGTITGNHVKGCFGFGPTLAQTAGYGIALVNITGAYLANCFPVVVSGNIVENLSNTAGYALAGIWVNWLECEIVGNIVTKTPGNGILLFRAFYGRCENNVLTDCCTDVRNGSAGLCAILVRSGSSFRIARNTIRGSSQSLGFVTSAGIDIDNTCVIEDNLCFGFTSSQQYTDSSGGGTNARRLRIYSSAAPAAGQFNAGDIVVNTDTTGTVEYWRCTVSGSPGTWVAHNF